MYTAGRLNSSKYVGVEGQLNMAGGSESSQSVVVHSQLNMAGFG